MDGTQSVIDFRFFDSLKVTRMSFIYDLNP